ncbi:MAG: hypothetical protein ACI4VF_09095 [Lachnospirales bacterium]
MEENSYTSNFKKTILFIIKVIIFIILVIPGVYKLGEIYSIATTENKINNYNVSRWNEFYSLEKNTIDMVYLGSSHSYCTFDPEIVDKILGTKGYQLGMPLQHYDSTYYTLKEVLNYQKPKTVILEVYWDMLDDEFELTQAGYLFQVMRNKDLENDYIKNVFPLSEKVKYRINIFRYQSDYFAYRNAKLKEKLENNFNLYIPEKEKQKGVEKYRSLGYTYCNYNMLEDEFDKTNQFKNLDGLNFKPAKEQVSYINKIAEICRENDIELIFVTAPIANVSMDYIKNYDVIHNFVQKLADSNSVKYLDFNLVNKEEELLTNDNFRDDAHLNHSGVEIVDDYFANWLKKIWEEKK